MQKIVWLFVCASMVISGSALAEEQAEQTKTKLGWSVLVGFANTKIEYEEHDSKIEDISLHLGGGYRVSRFFSIDLDYYRIDTEENKSDVFLSQSSLSARGIWPISDSFELWGKMGFVYGEYKVTHDINPTAKGDETSIVSAIGADYFVTPSIFIRAEYSNHNYEDISGDTLGINLGYLF